MTITEEILTKFLFFFLKHLTIELSNLAILTNHQQLPKKSILRKSSNGNENLRLNQKNSLHLIHSNRPKVLFTHIDSFVFDPQIPCQFLSPLQREEFYVSSHNPQMQCLCHQQSKINYQNKHKIKVKRQEK